MSSTTAALPHVMDPMYWIGPGGLFASAVLPGILIIVFIGMLFPFLPGDSLLFAGGLLAAGGTRGPSRRSGRQSESRRARREEPI